MYVRVIATGQNVKNGDVVASKMGKTPKFEKGWKFWSFLARCYCA